MNAFRNRALDHASVAGSLREAPFYTTWLYAIYRVACRTRCLAGIVIAYHFEVMQASPV